MIQAVPLDKCSETRGTYAFGADAVVEASTHTHTHRERDRLEHADHQHLVAEVGHL